MSLSFSKDDRGGAPLDSENSFNIAKHAHYKNIQARKSLTSVDNFNPNPAKTVVLYGSSFF